MMVSGPSKFTRLTESHPTVREFYVNYILKPPLPETQPVLLEESDE